MQLYAEQGFEQVTVAEIAERAGVTARTFFRYFADKREVLFAGSHEMGERLSAGLRDAAAELAPLPAAVAALTVVCELIGGDHQHSRRRQAVITGNPELRERELAKMASWSSALTDGLLRRGVDGPTATLAAETAVAVFRVAFAQWVDDPAGRTLAETLQASIERLSSLATGR